MAQNALSRRTLVAGLGAAIPASAVAVVPVLASGLIDHELAALHREFELLLLQKEIVDARLEETEEEFLDAVRACRKLGTTPNDRKLFGAVRSYPASYGYMGTGVSA